MISYLSNDYQGQTVLELDTGKGIDYEPKAAEEGHGFCWVKVTPSPDGRTLAVDGCYWACPYEIWFVDFTDPLDFPLVVLHREHELEEFFGWASPTEAKIGGQVQVCKLEGPYFGKREGECSYEDMDAIEALQSERGVADDDVWETQNVNETLWTRPTDYDAAKNYIESLRGWVEKGLALPEDYQIMVERHLRRVSADQATELRALLNP